MRIGIIGAGNAGTALGAGWAKAGHEIVYGARAAEKQSPHAGSTVDTVKNAVGRADVIVLATPWNAVDDALAAAGDLGGKPLIDATNPIGPGFALTLGHTSSGAEYVAARATNAHVVKGFNTTGFENMANPSYGESRVLMPLASNDSGALEIAARLAEDLGFDAVPLSLLSRARDLEPFGLLWIKLALVWGQGRNIAWVITKRIASDLPTKAKRSQHPRVITIVGSGNIGGALARAWIRSGHDVRIATRDANASDVQALVALGAKAVPLANAHENAEIVVFTTPASVVLETAKAIGNLDGKVLVDCTNAIGKGFALTYGHTTSSSEEIAKALPGVKVVRAFNQQGAEVLRNPIFGGRPATNFIAADDDDARAQVRELSNDAGLDSIEAGPLSSSRYLEPLTLLWIAIAQRLGTREIGLSLRRR